MRRICPRRLCRRGAGRGPVRGPGAVTNALSVSSPARQSICLARWVSVQQTSKLPVRSNRLLRSNAYSIPSPWPISSASFATARRVTDLVLRRWGCLCCGGYPARCKPFQGFVGDGGKLLPLEFTERPDELIVLSSHGS